MKRTAPNMKDFTFATVINFIACIFALAGVAHLSAAERTDKILIQGNAAGTQTVEQESGGAVRAEYSYNDRGRGDHIVATWKLDADGVPIEYEGRGNDYMRTSAATT